LLFFFFQDTVGAQIFFTREDLMDLNSQFTTFLIAAVVFYAGVALIYFCAGPAIGRMEDLDSQ